MALKIGDIQPGDWDDVRDMAAAIQAWAGKLDGLGKWVDVPFDATAFGSSAGSWTVVAGNQFINQFSILQDVMLWRLILGGTTTASMSAQLFVRLPPGWRCRDNFYTGLVSWNDNTGGGTDGVGKVFGTQDTGGKRLNIVRDVLPSSTAWPNSTANFALRFNLVMPVIPE